ncbi:MAG: Re/Si-specific NAD(P)(+) transhydrogenase subunit alpha [Candidatus Accumulibacter phosphatis]|uniref:NAD(P) transhydrogenase subunit alpha n=4 Tax=Candidatus Accumulibacter TaxID=327159 RepID=A0A080MB76_9PROT|nr:MULTISPECIES: Re/Si-specific NAD(P)(+) transhydrogenase subunit alpha [Candidatus Accumulibacter]KFB78216.1 MAG: NAD(P) transhydrogenase subunit alpha [Candidatus Accumulibacter cognatus]MBL8400536.1 Re/Si-specific NAD(P)(+) transhydrogenase subunit alpha [Accumulibacter sp.]MBN8517932.1 Re/Si-specific NAD(P)(+) transhydrogenase subunit alpha [Accumulibacter sp.]MCC2869802.1 Re/Si-specific NAD(P)(+) transhydrogenase subunit alpha [Candidatus Accumulibacter phosphatis]MCM8622266.1 Re/Si-spec
MPLTIGVPRETAAGEKRVATVPEVVEKLIKLGFAVLVESGAGEAASISDDAYKAAGAAIAEGAANLWSSSDIIFKVRGPSAAEVSLMREGCTLVSFIWPAQNPELLQQLTARKATVLAIDSLPRTLSRAQKMDALTSQAGVAGYRAVIEAANAFGRFFNGQITAAGKVPPAKVFVAGAGVAGLAAIGTAANLGAIVRANDTRAEVADQVASLGGEFVKVDYEEEGSGGGGYAKVMSEGFQKAQRDMYAKQAREVDIIITTALIPGKPAPKLITAEMVRSMKAGSVIVDMAAEQGGNCELTEAGQAVVKHDVTIIGYTDLVSRLARQSSTLYSTNLLRLAEELCKTKDGIIDVNMEDEAIRGLTVIKEGNVTWPPPAPKPSAAPVAAPAAAQPAAAAKKSHGHGKASEPASGTGTAIMFIAAAILFWFIGASAPPAFLGHFTVFVLACFVGYMVVWNVKPALHTPLMSVTNAVSSIIAIGALVQIAPPIEAGLNRPEDWIRWLAIGAIVLATINMFGGFAVTQRMLAMFRK